MSSSGARHPFARSEDLIATPTRRWRSALTRVLRAGRLVLATAASTWDQTTKDDIAVAFGQVHAGARLPEGA